MDELLVFEDATLFPILDFRAWSVFTQSINCWASRYWQGATGRQLKISDDEQLQREMEKAAAEEAMHEGGGRARFHLKDDSDSGQEDEDDYANYNDQARPKPSWVMNQPVTGCDPTTRVQDGSPSPGCLMLVLIFVSRSQ